MTENSQPERTLHSVPHAATSSTQANKQGHKHDSAKHPSSLERHHQQHHDHQPATDVNATATETQQQTESNQRRSKMMMLRKRKPQGKSLLLIIAAMAFVTVIFVMFEYDLGNDAADRTGLSANKEFADGDDDDDNTDGRAGKYQPRKGPTRRSDDDDIEDGDKQKAISFWDRHSDRSNRMKSTNNHKKRKDKLALKDGNHHGHGSHNNKDKKKHGNKKKRIQVIDFPDSPVPHAALPAGAIIKAADALMCEATIIDYVINATDLRDECIGLQKAFEATCTDGAEEEQDVSTQGRGRRLSSLDDGSSNRTTQEASAIPHDDRIRRKNNPIKSVQSCIYRITKRIRKWRMFGHIGNSKIGLQDQVEMEYADAKYEVENEFVATQYKFKDSINTTRIERGLKEIEAKQQQKAETTAEPDKSQTSANGVAKKPHADANDAKANPNNAAQNRPKPNMNVPIASAHVSSKALQETLMLQNNDKVMESVVRASVDQAAVNASNPDGKSQSAVSAKAVSDTLEAVNAVLNDPTSIEARSCCTSILSVFNENCGPDDEEELSDKRLFIVVAVIALCGLVKSLIRHFDMKWLPEAAGCILVGVGSGWVLSSMPHHDISFDGNWFLRIMVPPIVFEAAVGIDKRSFNRHIVPILFYAVIGTVFATVATAMIVHKGSAFFHNSCETIPYIDALAFGALISSIDPIAVLSVLSNMGMTDTDTIYVLIFGESLLNDGIAIVLFETLVHFLDDHLRVDANAVMAATIHFFVVAVGSLLIGVASGYCATLYYWMMHGCQTPLVEVIMFFCWALIPYYICDGIEWSGIVAVVATGFVMDLNIIGPKNSMKVNSFDYDFDRDAAASPSSRSRRPVISKVGHLSSEAKTHVGFVTEIVATTMETAIFAYLGLFLFSSRYHWNAHHTMLAISGCCISRAIMIPILGTLANWVIRMQQGNENCQWGSLPQQQQQSSQQSSDSTQQNPGRPAGVVIDRKMQLVLWFAGLRGAMSFALVENIPLYNAATGQGSRVKSEIKAMTSASIVFTVFILGGGTYYMMESLGLAPSSGSKPPRRQTSRNDDVEMIGLLRDDSDVGTMHEEEIMTSNNNTNNDVGQKGNRKRIFRQRLPQRDD